MIPLDRSGRRFLFYWGGYVEIVEIFDRRLEVFPNSLNLWFQDIFG
jgi:hypothetical protein